MPFAVSLEPPVILGEDRAALRSYFAHFYQLLGSMQVGIKQVIQDFSLEVNQHLSGTH
jgi:hypothetical protein